MTNTFDVAQHAAFLDELRQIERYAVGLIEANRRVRAMGHADTEFYAVRLGMDGLDHWRRFLEKEFELTW